MFSIGITLVIPNWIMLLILGVKNGEGGGEVVATGTPEEIVGVKGSWTGKYLKKII